MTQLLNIDTNNVFFRCVEDCNEAIMITNLNGELIYVNAAWCEIYEYKKEEALGNNPRILHSGLQTKEFYRAMWQNISNPNLGNWKGELINKSKSGKFVPVLLTITPFRDESGDIKGHMGIAMDLSDQKRLETKVLHQDRLASIGMLSSGLAHEIGTPLSVVRGRAELMLEQCKNLNANHFESGFKTIINQIDRISLLIKSLLKFSRTKQEVELTTIDFQEVINEVLNLVGQNLRTNSIQFQFLPNCSILLRSDFNRLQQILINLFINSVHAINKQKEIDESLKGLIEVTARKNGGYWIISISDNGTGITQENQRKLFQPFFTTKDVGEGTGLGLAIVLGLVHELLGEISVESTFGTGTSFLIKLPCAD